MTDSQKPNGSQHRPPQNRRPAAPDKRGAAPQHQRPTQKKPASTGSEAPRKHTAAPGAHRTGMHPAVTPTGAAHPPVPAASAKAHQPVPHKAAPAQPQKPKVPKKPRPKWARALSRLGSITMTTLLSFTLIFIITGVIVATAMTVYVLGFLEETSAVTISDLEMSYSTFIYANNAEGDLVTLHQVDNEVKRLPIEIEDIPQNVRDAFVYVEDERFYLHDGVDYKRTFGAFANMFLHFWATDQGGSTITQQLVKNITGDNQTSPERKIREIFRAMQIEKSYTKDEILEGYLNYIGFGGSANGIQMAALKYFGKDAKDLTTAEAACLAAIPKSPETMNPFAYYIDDVTGEKVVYGREKNRERQEYVLAQMYKNGALNFDDYQRALSEKMVFTDSEEYAQLHPESTVDQTINQQTATSWVVDTALREYAAVLVDEYGITEEQAISRINKGGYKIYTTVDLDMQAYVEQKFLDLNNMLAGMTTAQATADWRDLDGDGQYSAEEAQYLQMSFTAMDYSGNILAIVGGIGEKTESLAYNRATKPRQCGSTIKPVSTYGLALSTDFIHWGSMLKNSAPLIINGKPWPTNYSSTSSDNFGNGQLVPVYKALQNSLNTIPALLCKEQGTDAVYTFSKDKLGLQLDPADDDYSPLSVGGLTYGVSITNLINAYMPYGNGGNYSKAHIISRVESGDGTLVYSGGTDYAPVIDAETATVMNHLLQNVIENGTGKAAKLTAANGTKVPLAGKTGTTTNWNDLTFVGMTPKFVSGMWIGYDMNGKMKNHGSLSSPKLWKNIIGEYISTHYAGETFTDCDTVIAAPICTATGCIAGASCPKGETGYWKSTNAPYCSGHKAASTEEPKTTKPAQSAE